MPETKKNQKLGPNQTQRARNRKPVLLEKIKNFRLTRDLVLRAAIILAVSVVTVMLTNPLKDTYQDFKVGVVAKRTVRSDHAFVVVDPLATDEARVIAYNSAMPLFILDDLATNLVLENAKRIFRHGRLILALNSNVPHPRFKDQFCQVFRVENCDYTLTETWKNGFNHVLERQVTWLTLELMTQGVMAEEVDNSFFEGRNVEIGRVGTGRTITSFESILNFPRAKLIVEARMKLISGELGSGGDELVTSLVMGLLRPNIVLDQNILWRRRFQATSNVKDVVHRVTANEIIIREGETVTPLTEIKLLALRSDRIRELWFKRSLGLLLILTLFMFITQWLNSVERKEGISLKPLTLMSVLLMVFIILAWWSGHLVAGTKPFFDFIEPHTAFMAMPIPVAAMLGAIFLGTRRAVFLCFLGSFLGAVVAPLDTLSAFIYICNGCLVSITKLGRLSERGRLIPAAALTALVNCLSMTGLTIMDGDIFSQQFIYDTYAAVLSGLLSGILASGLVPAIESLTGITTNLKLMELGNLNRPLLRDLMLRAPGTYHHSVIVGSMVEAAAEVIGANPHLARVGAYYHDIGKMKKPLYFIENQMGENKHESLTPTMSALVLVGHVKEGVDLARENKLPQMVINIVEQHHGTSLMAYFYHKARENRGPNMAEINEGDFRYPGPKPNSKEAGLVMLADICEAATRTLTEPTPTKIQELVRTLVNKIFNDGQLDNCDLVLKELTEAMQVFTNILIGIYHHRIVYPVISKEAERHQAARSKIIYDNLNNEQSKRVTH
ncbi:MAG: HDIG domain-containing protein [Deltaproteobacteria bacterium]|jgi:putative nucleotidyltransferase with HDIG domain|nr:HDIG domain-containing protein [Deltaproteobacteria bacterium]